MGTLELTPTWDFIFNLLRGSMLVEHWSWAHHAKTSKLLASYPNARALVFATWAHNWPRAHDWAAIFLLFVSCLTSQPSEQGQFHVPKFVLYKRILLPYIELLDKGADITMWWWKLTTFFTPQKKWRWWSFVSCCTLMYAYLDKYVKK